MKLIRSMAIAAMLIVPTAIGISACAELQNIVTAPTDASTLADATQAATLATQAVDLYVNTGTPSKAVLQELQSLNNVVHSSIVDLENAQKNGQPLSFAAFNAAMDAFNDYAAQQGIKT